MKKNLFFITLIIIIASATAYITSYIIAAKKKELTSMKGQQCVLSNVSVADYAKRLKVKYKTNGERIYYTATSASKKDIVADTSVMKMTNPMMSCVDCHQTGGKGGTVKLMMGTYKIPNITYEELKEEKFSDADIKNAITKALEPNGEHLKFPMPKWRMNEKDLDELVKYLKTL